jgi:16S rRNA (uracil1498-N3)-methyltransferase
MRADDAPRFFVSPDQIKESRIRITGPDVNHIARVLRLGRGSALTILDGKGKSYAAVIQELVRDEVFCEINKELPLIPACPVKVTLVQGIPKGDKMDLIIQKGAELGVSRVLPLICSRSVVRLAGDRLPRKQERWQRIALEAAKQCRRPDVPEVAEPAELDGVLGSLPANCTALIPWEEENKVSLKDLLSEVRAVEEIYVFIGPEGGFTAGEVAAAQAAGVRPVTLGPRILRTETAGIAVITMVLCRWGDLGGKINVKEEGGTIHPGL